LGLRKNRSRCGTGFRHAAFPASSSRRWRRRVDGDDGWLLGFGQRTDDGEGWDSPFGSGGSSRNGTCRPLPPSFRPCATLTSIHKIMRASSKSRPRRPLFLPSCARDRRPPCPEKVSTGLMSAETNATAGAASFLHLPSARYQYPNGSCVHGDGDEILASCVHSRGDPTGVT